MGKPIICVQTKLGNPSQNFVENDKNTERDRKQQQTQIVKAGNALPFKTIYVTQYYYQCASRTLAYSQHIIQKQYSDCGTTAIKRPKTNKNQPHS